MHQQGSRNPGPQQLRALGSCRVGEGLRGGWGTALETSGALGDGRVRRHPMRTRSTLSSGPRAPGGHPPCPSCSPMQGDEETADTLAFLAPRPPPNDPLYPPPGCPHSSAERGPPVHPMGARTHGPSLTPTPQLPPEGPVTRTPRGSAPAGWPHGSPGTHSGSKTQGWKLGAPPVGTRGTPKSRLTVRRLVLKSQVVSQPQSSAKDSARDGPTSPGLPDRLACHQPQRVLLGPPLRTWVPLSLQTSEVTSPSSPGNRGLWVLCTGSQRPQGLCEQTR